MADATTNSGTALAQLAEANSRLASATSSQYQNIKKLLNEIKSSTPSSPNPRSSSYAAGATISDQNIIKLLQSEIKNRWIVGGFCSSHGWGVSYRHSSATCNNKLAGHDDTATRANPSGPVKTKNKGWDSFVT